MSKGLGPGEALKFGLRFLQSKNRRGRFKGVTRVSILGLAIGVATLTVTLGILSGFDREYKKALLGLGAHGVILAYGGIEAESNIEEKLAPLEGLRGLSPYVLGEGVVGYEGRVSGAIIKGIDPKKAKNVTQLQDLLQDPEDWQGLQTVSADGLPQAIIGKTLAKRLKLASGETLQLILGDFTEKPQIFPIHVVGTFYSGMHEFDSRFIYLPLEAAQKFLGLNGRYTGLELAVNHPEDIDTLAERVDRLLSYPHYMLTWKQLNANLFKALKLEKVVFFLVILPIVLVGALTLIAVLMMHLMHRKRDIAILRTMGMPNRWVGRIFLAQGLFIGMWGILSGLLLGVLIKIFLLKVPLVTIDPEIYFIDHLPIDFNPLDYGLIGVCTLLIAFLATWIPARKAGRLNPVEAIRGY